VQIQENGGVEYFAANVMGAVIPIGDSLRRQSMSRDIPEEPIARRQSTAERGHEASSAPRLGPRGACALSGKGGVTSARSG
jgi:hypothetical protein